MKEGVERVDSRANHRRIAGPGGLESETWMERETARVKLYKARRTSSGGGSGHGTWARCRAEGCLGERVVAGDSCLAHASDAERSQYLSQQKNSGQVIKINGVVVDEGLWAQIAPSGVGVTGTTTSPVFASGATFPFKLRVSGHQFLGHMEFSAAIFEDGCEISESHFLGGVNFDFTDFRNGPGYFPRCTFARSFHLNSGHTSQHVAFVEGDFQCTVRAEGFAGDLRFDDSNITGDLLLGSGKLSLLSLAGLTLSGQVDLAGAEARSLRAPKAAFEAATAFGPVSVEGQVDLGDAQFGSRVAIELEGTKATFSGANLRSGGRVDLRGCEVIIDRLMLGGPVILTGRSGAAIASMSGADAHRLTLSGVDLERCSFHGAHGLEGLAVDSSVQLPLAPRWFRTRRRCIADEFAWRGRHARWRRSDWLLEGTRLEPPGKGEYPDQVPVLPQVTASQVSGTYRSLRMGMEGRANEPGAADFYYGEMEMRRRDSSASRFERVIVFLYWLFAGYGLRSLRAVAFLALAVALGAVGIHKHGFIDESPGLWPAALESMRAALPGTRSDSAAFSDWGLAIETALTVVGPVLLGLALLAVRNRVKR